VVARGVKTIRPYDNSRALSRRRSTFGAKSIDRV